MAGNLVTIAMLFLWQVHRRKDVRTSLATLAVLAWSLSLLAHLPVLAQEGGWLERWRSRNDRGNRYEGRIEIPVSGSALELLSIVGQMEPFRDSVELSVRFFVPTDEQIACGLASPATKGVQVEARELREDKLYYMESKPGKTNWKPGE